MASTILRNRYTSNKDNNIDYPLVEEDKTIYYNHPIHKFDFTALDGMEKWIAYRFITDVYDKFRPMNLKRIYSAIDMLPPNIDLGVSEKLDSQVLDDTQHLPQQSEAHSLSTNEQNDSQASLVMSREATPSASFSEQTFRRPKQGPKALRRLASKYATCMSWRRLEERAEGSESGLIPISMRKVAYFLSLYPTLNSAPAVRAQFAGAFLVQKLHPLGIDCHCLELIILMHLSEI